MSQELLPCPLVCGGTVEASGPAWVYHKATDDCPLGGQYVPLYVWNRRTPDAASEKVRREVAEEMERGEYSVGRGRDNLTPLQVRQAWRAKLLEGLGAE